MGHAGHVGHLCVRFKAWPGKMNENCSNQLVSLTAMILSGVMTVTVCELVHMDTCRKFGTSFPIKFGDLNSSGDVNVYQGVPLELSVYEIYLQDLSADPSTKQC